MLTIDIPSIQALPQAAEQVREAIAGHSIICFEGEMGAGKTTFIKALCQSLGVADDVSSPTFSLVNEYRDAQDQPIYHFDFYRVDSEEEAARLGAAEYFDSGYLCLVEWPSRVAGLLPPQRLLVELAATGPESRTLTINSEQ